MISRNGVYYDLQLSNFRFKNGNLIFVFSSQLHLNNFKKKYKENRDIINYSLSKRFKCKVDVSQLADVVLYRKIETRGFLIVTVEGKELCQNNLTFDGLEVIIPNYRI